VTARVYRASPVKRHRRTNDDLALVDAAICQAVEDDHPVSLRGVYYRVVSAGAIEKTEAGYNVIMRQLLKLRRDGTISYSYITDGTRLIRKSASWDELDEMLWTAAESYRRALWNDQDVEVMVFTEKDAISGILFPVTDHWDVPLGVLRGYASETFCYSIAEEILAAHRRSKYVIVYQFGDHDPSGVNAWESFTEKVGAFVSAKLENGATGKTLPLSLIVEFERLAVTPEQIVEYDLPTRPTKASDTRADKFEGESVEVDAIPASELRLIAQHAITQHIDLRALQLTQLAEDSERDILTRLAGGGFRFVDEQGGES